MHLSLLIILYFSHKPKKNNEFFKWTCSATAHWFFQLLFCTPAGVPRVLPARQERMCYQQRWLVHSPRWLLDVALAAEPCGHHSNWQSENHKWFHLKQKQTNKKPELVYSSPKLMTELMLLNPMSVSYFNDISYSDMSCQKLISNMETQLDWVSGCGKKHLGVMISRVFSIDFGPISKHY